MERNTGANSNQKEVEHAQTEAAFSLSYWIYNNRELAFKTIDEIAPPAAARYFKAYVEGAIDHERTIEESAVHIGVSYKGFRKRVGIARTILSTHLGHPPIKGSKDQSLDSVKRELTLKDTFLREKQSETPNPYAILELFSSVVENSTKDMSAEEKELVIAKVAGKLTTVIKGMDYQGLSQLRSYIRLMFRTQSVDAYRTKARNTTEARTPSTEQTHVVVDRPPSVVTIEDEVGVVPNFDELYIKSNPNLIPHSAILVAQNPEHPRWNEAMNLIADNILPRIYVYAFDSFGTLEGAEQATTAIVDRIGRDLRSFKTNGKKNFGVWVFEQADQEIQKQVQFSRSGGKLSNALRSLVGLASKK